MQYLSTKQSDFLKNATRRYNVAVGAVRSGKTYAHLFLIPQRIMATHGKSGLRVILGNTRSTVERNIIDPLRQIYGDHLIGTLRANNTIDMFGEKVYCLGAEKANNVTKLQGAGIRYAYADELTTWNIEVFRMLQSRLSYSDSILDGTANPDSPNHFFKKFLDSEADIYQQSYTIYDNPFLSKEFVKNLELEYKDTVYYDRFILGEWKKSEGLVYSNYDIEKDPIDEVPELLTGESIVSIDYGTSNPCVYLLFEKGESGTWYLTREYYYSGKDSYHQKTDTEYLQDYLDFTADKNVTHTIIDPSALSFIVTLQQAGVNVRRGNNKVIDGIRVTMSALNQGKIKVLKSCENTLREFTLYSWQPNTSVDTPIKENDHTMDALRYFAMTALRPLTGAYAV